MSNPGEKSKIKTKKQLKIKPHGNHHSAKLQYLSFKKNECCTLYKMINDEIYLNFTSLPMVSKTTLSTLN